MKNLIYSLLFILFISSCKVQSNGMYNDNVYPYFQEDLRYYNNYINSYNLYYWGYRDLFYSPYNYYNPYYSPIIKTPKFNNIRPSRNTTPRGSTNTITPRSAIPTRKIVPATEPRRSVSPQRNTSLPPQPRVISPSNRTRSTSVPSAVTRPTRSTTPPRRNN